MNRETIKIISEKHHAAIHITLALLIWYAFGANWSHLVWYLIAGYFPDIDHVFFIFGYGRNTQYAVEIRKRIYKLQIGDAVKYILKHHKENTGIKSHNLVVVTAMLGLSLFFGYIDQGFWSGMFMALFGHFAYDIAEDLLFFGKLNKNWWLKFD